MICPVCNCEVENNTRFCPSCGAQLEFPNTSATTPQNEASSNQYAGQQNSYSAQTLNSGSKHKLWPKSGAKSQLQPGILKPRLQPVRTGIPLLQALWPAAECRVAQLHQLRRTGGCGQLLLPKLRQPGKQWGSGVHQLRLHPQSSCRQSAQPAEIQAGRRTARHLSRLLRGTQLLPRLYGKGSHSADFDDCRYSAVLHCDRWVYDPRRCDLGPC